MTHLDRPHHQVTAIADGARGHTQREMKTARDIAGSSCNDSDKVLFAKTMRHPPTRGRSATLWMAAALLAMTWIWEAQAFPDQVRHLADANHATAARNFDSDGTVGHGAFEALPPGRDGNDKSVQVAQVTTSDAGQSPELQRLEQERKWLEENRVDLEAWLQASLQQERERSARLAQDLAAAWRDVETQAALAAKASEEASQRRQAAEASATELKQSMQKERERADALALDLSMTRSAIYAYEAQARKAGDEAAELRQAVANDAPSLRKSAQDERERADRLAQDLAAARRDIEIQTALATKASEEASRLKQAGKPTALEFQKSLQQEREWSAQMEQNFAAARRDVETQTALAAKATKEAARLKQAGESGAEELQKSLQQQRERSARLEQDLAATRRDVETQTALAARASEEAARTRQEAEREFGRVAQLAAAGARQGRTARKRSPACATRCVQCRDGRFDRAGQVCRGKREARRRPGTGRRRSGRCPAQFRAGCGGGGIGCARKRAARAGQYRRSADRAGARRRDGQRPGELLARRNL